MAPATVASTGAVPGRRCQQTAVSTRQPAMAARDRMLGRLPLG